MEWGSGEEQGYCIDLFVLLAFVIKASRIDSSHRKFGKPTTLTMSNNVLDPSAIVSLLPTLLPSTSKTLTSSHDGLAALLHTAMSAVAFRLVGVHETVVISPSAGNALPVEWNSHGPESYSFKYRHDQSSLEFVMKISKLGGRTLVNAIAVEVRLALISAALLLMLGVE